MEAKATLHDTTRAWVSEIRSPDGVHFNTDGYTLVTEKAAQLATKDFNLDPKTYAP